MIVRIYGYNGKRKQVCVTELAEEGQEEFFSNHLPIDGGVRFLRGALRSLKDKRWGKIKFVLTSITN